MKMRTRAVATLLVAYTLVAVAAAGLSWLAVRNGGRDVPFPGLLAAQLASWYLWAAFTPLVLRLGRRWRPRADAWEWCAPHVGAAVVVAVARSAIELLYLLPAEGMPITGANLWLGLRGNVPFGLLFDVAVYAAILAFGTILVGSTRSPAGAEPLDRIAVKAAGRTVFVEVDAIDWVEAADYYACLHADGTEYLVRESLARLEERLAPRQFLRVHRSAIVNLRRVASLQPHGRGDAVATLADGTTVKVSRTNLASLRSAMNGEATASSGV